MSIRQEINKAFTDAEARRREVMYTGSIAKRIGRPTKVVLKEMRQLELGGAVVRVPSYCAVNNLAWMRVIDFGGAA
ncbi:hypothetical protein [Stenotrophomonas maltophilia]|uniref:hypothetical protein n=1 Tax=Stenotrophomonas maltophilia TaxID=40324 RepID=UPI00106F1BAC|nr:hypothetical protein [Stenotrophomonas maltophilia]